MDAESRVLVARIRKEHELAAMGFCSWRMKVREREEGREGEKERGTERESVRERTTGPDGGNRAREFICPKHLQKDGNWVKHVDFWA